MQALKQLLANYPKKMIDLSQLEKLYNPHVNSYDQFSQLILAFEEENILEMVKSKGRTMRSPQLAYQYRINKYILATNHHNELQSYRQKLHPSINLDEYFRKDPSVWENDLPYLLKINQFIQTEGFPNQQVPAPERSFELVGDEKWINEKGGKEILERVGLFNKLNIIPVSEPLMFAINPNNITETEQIHLIVENKTTYQGLLPALIQTNFSTLIYGRGKVIIQSIEQFSNQYPVNGHHHFFYFGDIDREGVSIWHSLTKKQEVKLALPFYEACLKYEPVKGKDYQNENKEAVNAFLIAFSKNNQEKIKKLLNDGFYYPQEVLKSTDLQTIWRETDWMALI